MQTISRDRLPPSIVELYMSYVRTSADAKPAFAYDSYAEWRAGMDRVLSLADQIISTHTDEDIRLAGQEREFFEKGNVNWRDRGLGALCVDDGAVLSCRNEAQAAGLAVHFERRSDYYQNWLRRQGPSAIAALMSNGQVRITRGKGSPFWLRGTEPLGAVALRRLCRDYFSDLDGLRRALTALAGDRPIFVQSSYLRIQGNRKHVTAWIPAAMEMGITPYGERLGPKVRRIAAQPFVLNHWIAPYGDMLRLGMAETPNGQHAGQIAPVLEMASHYKYHFATDLSSYDTTVSFETLRLFQQLVVNPFVKAAYDMVPRDEARALRYATPDLIERIDQEMQSMAILTPSTLYSGAAMLWEAQGQTRSGENLTSFKGTEIRRAQAIAKLESLGFSSSDAFIFNYGDDTLLMTNNESLVDAWSAEPSYLGLNETAAADASFLMRRVPHGYAYIGRMVMACINREPKQEPSDELAAAASIAVRYGLLVGHPWRDSFFKLLEAYGGPERFRRAVTLAKQIAASGSGLDRTLALSQMSARADTIRRGVAAERAEAQQQQLRALLQNIQLTKAQRQNISETVMSLTHAGDAGVMRRQFLSWRELDTQAERMSLKECQTYLHSRISEQRTSIKYTSSDVNSKGRRHQ